MDSRDAKVVEGLRNAGSKLDLPHPVRHYVYVPNRSAAEDAGASLRKAGFEVEVSPAAMGDDWLILASHRVMLSEAEIASFRTRFEALAVELAGEYDGWEAAITRS
jgi:hypothetical protein